MNDIVITEQKRLLEEYARRTRAIPSDYYSLWQPANFFMHTSRTRIFFQMLQANRPVRFSTQKILEIGCGYGGWLPDFVRWGVPMHQVAGIDIDQSRLYAAQRHLPLADLRLGNAASLPWPDHSFDVVVQSTVFSSILQPEVRRIVAKEIMRVCRPQGFVLWFDLRYNNPRNQFVRGIPAAEIRRLFPDTEIIRQSLILAPPLLRLLAKRSWFGCWLLEKIPWLRTHYLALIFSTPKAA